MYRSFIHLSSCKIRSYALFWRLLSYVTFFINCLGEGKRFYRKTGNPNLLRPSVLTGWLLVVCFTGMLQEALAQNFNGSGSASARIVNFTQLAATQASRPLEQTVTKVPNEYGERKTKSPLPMNLPLPANAHIVRDQFGPIITPQTAPPFNSPGSNSPAPLTNFAALEDNNTIRPPDTHGAAGPNHVMVTLNSQVRIQTRTGTTLGTVSLKSFFGTNAFDPRIHYDPYNGRWIFVASANAFSPESGWYIAISQNSDPTGNWYKYGVNDFDASNAEWADYPTVGFNKNWITIQINRFSLPGSNFLGSRIYALTKSEFYAGGTATWRFWTRNDNLGATQAPAVTYNNVINEQYLLQTWSGNDGGQGYLRIYTINGAIGSETFTETGPAGSAGLFISTANPWADRRPDAPQSGSINRISTNDARMQNVVYRNGSLWATHTVFLPAASPNRASVQWWQVSPTGVVQQRGRIDDGTAANFFAFPSIAVNGANDVLIGYSRFSGTRYASANYSFRLGTHAVNTLQPDYTFKEGEDTYFKPDDTGRNRWGDYSATVVDPVNDQDFWTIQEYAETSVGETDRWGTWWARVSTIPIPVPPAPTGLTATALNRSQIRLTWSDVSGETGYRIYRYSAGVASTQIATVGADVTTFTDSGLAAWTNYAYYLQAYNTSGNSPQTPAVGATTASLSQYVMDGAPVSTCNGTFYDPGFYSKYGNNQSITQTFSPTSVNSKVQLSFSSFYTESGFDVLRIYDGPTTASPLIGTYSGNIRPVVTATNPTGQLTVQFTSNGSGVESGWEAAISCVIIAAPTNLTATTLNRSQIRLTWSDVSGETGYRIYRNGSGSTSYTQLATVGADVTTYTDSGLTAGTSYYYYLQAYNAAGNSLQTPPVGAYTVGLSDYVMDGSPVSACNGTFYDPGFYSKYGNNQSFTQTFSPSTLGSKVRLHFSSFHTESGFDFLRIYDGPTTTSPLLGTYSGYTWPGLITATNPTGQLTVQFTSNGSVVESGWVATISCIFIAEPTNLTTTALNRSQIRLNWSDVSGETGYRIYRSGFGGYTQIATVGADVTTFTDSGLTAGTGYYYYLQAYNAFGNSPQTPTVYAHTATLSDYVMDGSPVSTCDGTFYDPGFNNKYGNNQSFTQTFSPTSVNSKVRLTFSRFVTESGFDVLRIYDGPSTASPLLGTYSGTMWPGIVTATNATGQLTVQFTSNGTVVESGWQAAISCPPVISSFAPNSAPVGAAVAIKGSNFSSSTSITVRFNGVNAPNFTLESSNLVVATVPPGATSGPIEVTSKGVTVTSASNLTIAPVTSIWQPKTDVPTARGQHGAVALPSNGQVYVFGGAGNTNLADNINSMEVYNPNTNAWAAGAPMPVATRSMAYTLGSDGLIYVFGGLTRNGYNNRSYRFNPLTNTWTSVADSPSYAWGASAAATSNGKIYLFGGRGTGGPMTNETHVYTIATNSWAAAAPMPIAVGHHRAVTGQNGKIYVFGGKTSVADGLSDLVQIYTPATNSWAFGAPMPIAKCLFGTIQSNNGKIYFIGGKTAFYLSFQRDQFFHTVEIYDPATNTWSAGPPLSAPVGDMTTVNANGNVFLMGGTSAYTHYRNFNWQLVVPPSAPSGGVSVPPFNDQPTAARVSVEPALKLEASPNPFSEKVVLRFTVEKSQAATLEIYDLKGTLLSRPFDKEAKAGQAYQVEWDASPYGAGMYMSRLVSGDKSVQQKLLLQR